MMSIVPKAFETITKGISTIMTNSPCLHLCTCSFGRLGTSLQYRGTLFYLIHIAVPAKGSRKKKNFSKGKEVHHLRTLAKTLSLMEWVRLYKHAPRGSPNKIFCQCPITQKVSCNNPRAMNTILCPVLYKLWMYFSKPSLHHCGGFVSVLKTEKFAAFFLHINILECMPMQLHKII